MMGKKGKLYMVPCPLGDTPPYDVLPAKNREIIQSLDYFIVENLRSARRFLSKAGIGKPIDSLLFRELNEHTGQQDIEDLIKPILEGRDAGVISEAGLPGIADPGSEVVSLCHKNNIKIIPLVGPSSILLALMASGLNGQSFSFNGYLPVKTLERVKAIRFFERRAVTESQSQIFIEAPYRNIKLLGDILETCNPETMLTIAADILEPSEFILTAPIRRWRQMPQPDINKRPAIFIIL